MPPLHVPTDHRLCCPGCSAALVAGGEVTARGLNAFGRVRQRADFPPLLILSSSTYISLLWCVKSALKRKERLKLTRGGCPSGAGVSCGSSELLLQPSSFTTDTTLTAVSSTEVAPCAAIYIRVSVCHLRDTYPSLLVYTASLLLYNLDVSALRVLCGVQARHAVVTPHIVGPQQVAGVTVEGRVGGGVAHEGENGLL